MKGMTAQAVLAMLICSLAILVPSAAEDSEAALQDDYPDADVIICEGENGYVSLIYRMSSDDSPSYYTRTVRSGGDARLFSTSEGRSSMNVVMVGGSLGSLAVLTLDRYDRGIVPADISFDMKGGSIGVLQMVLVPSGVASSLPSSYYSAFRTISQLNVTIGGFVSEFNPTSALIGVSSLDLRIVDGARINRLYPTGSNGSYGSVDVTMTGGAVGYMSNQRSYIGSLRYSLVFGSIDYLCIGADSEGGAGYSLSNFWTSYVRYGVDVSMGEFFDVGTAVVGSGIIDVPSILCNSQIPETVIARNVVLDCLPATISVDRCFSSSDGKVYRFSSYVIGGSPSSGSMHSTYYTSYQSRAVYGDDGIWPSILGIDIGEGVQATFNTHLMIGSDATLHIAPGAIVVNANRIILQGTIVNDGSFKNNSVVEERSGGSFVGMIDGEGVLAYSIIVLPSKEGRVDVMAESDDAVVLRAEDGDLFFNTASIYLKSSNSKIVLTAPPSMYIGGDSFTVGLKKTYATANTQTWSLFLSGFDADSPLSIDVMIPLRLADGFRAEISSPDGSEAEILSIQDGVLSFRANGSGDYLISAVMTEDPGGGSLLSGMSLNIIVAVLITIVAAIVVYLLLRDA